jgi:glycerol-3-phosphate acyltransferase PlsX
MPGTLISRPRVAVDVMGGDRAPGVVLEGVVSAARALDVRLQLVGPRAAVESGLAQAGGAGLQVEVIDAPDVISMGEKVSRATLKKRSSIQAGLERVRDGQADAFFSAGNTAACWTIAKLVLGTLEEVDRPALAAVVPNVDSYTVLIDVGANANCKARQLEEFAVMGTIYSTSVLHTRTPRVGLMSMGEEEGKGNDLTREVHEVLKQSSLNFIGNVEGRDIYSGRVDVVVMDGFTGNVVLKASEALAASVMQVLRRELMASPLTRLGAWLARPAFRRVRKRVDAAEYGGAPLLGVRGCCVIGHGSSNSHAIHHGIRAAAEFFTSGVNAQIEAELRGLKARTVPAAESA